MPWALAEMTHTHTKMSEWLFHHHTKCHFCTHFATEKKTQKTFRAVHINIAPILAGEWISVGKKREKKSVVFATHCCFWFIVVECECIYMWHLCGACVCQSNDYIVTATSRRQSDHSGKSCICIPYEFSVAMRRIFVLLWFCNSFIHSVAEFLWLAGCLAISTCQRVGKCPLDAWLRQPDFMPGNGFSSNWLYSTTSIRPKKLAISSTDAKDKEWFKLTFFFLADWRILHCCWVRSVFFRCVR